MVAHCGEVGNVISTQWVASIRIHAHVDTTPTLTPCTVRVAVQKKAVWWHLGSVFVVAVALSRIARGWEVAERGRSEAEVISDLVAQDISKARINVAGDGIAILIAGHAEHPVVVAGNEILRAVQQRDKGEAVIQLAHADITEEVDHIIAGDYGVVANDEVEVHLINRCVGSARVGDDVLMPEM